jgi:2-methylcitrate dehydratase PrpD
MSATNITEELKDLGAWLWPAARYMPVSVCDKVKRLWLDTSACAYAGLRSEAMQSWLSISGEVDPGMVPLPGNPTKLSMSASATAFAMGACWDEACEGLAIAHGRPGVPVIAALWPQLSLLRVTWDDLWQASAVGYEVAARLGAKLRIRPGMHVDGVWGAFGAAVALIWLSGGTWAQAQAAIEACAVQLPFSLYHPVKEGANIRNLYLGHSAWLGCQAAHAVLAGLSTPQGSLDVFAQLALADAPEGQWPAQGTWLIEQSYWKPFAAVRHVHYGAQAAITMRTRIGEEQVRDISALRLQVYPEALQYCGNRHPQSVIQAQFSLSFGVAAGLAYGDLSPEEFRAPRFDDPSLRRLEALVAIVPDPESFPEGQRGAILCAKLGEAWHHESLGAITGDLGHDPNHAMIQRKYAKLTQDDLGMRQWAELVLLAKGSDLARHPGHFTRSGQ